MPRITTICIPFLLLQALASVKCQVTECTRQQFIESSAYDKNFDTTVLQPTYPLKKQVKVPCRTGYTGFFKLVCSETGWETIGGPCQAKSCGHPGDAQFADFQLESGNDFVFASTVVYTCHKGYQMVSRSNRRRCMADGWDGHIPTCEAVKCESLPVNDNVQVSGDPEDGTYGNVIRFSCKSRNQILKGPTEIYCDESGEWSGSVPECKEVSCDTPQIPHGRVTDPPKLYRENEHLNFVCDNKYKPADDRRSRCLKVGSEAVWSPTPQCTLIQCKVNLPPIPGTRYNRYDKNMFSPGDTLTVTCDGDRWIVDMKTTSAVVTCNDNGNWDIIPECKDVSCHDRRDQYLLYFNDYWGRRKMNDRVPYSCKRGYEKPSGVTHATCTRDGWMPERLCEEHVMRSRCRLDAAQRRSTTKNSDGPARVKLESLNVRVSHSLGSYRLRAVPGFSVAGLAAQSPVRCRAFFILQPRFSAASFSSPPHDVIILPPLCILQSN